MDSIESMEFRYLGNSGLKISEITYGNWLTHGSQVENDVAAQCVRAALDAGISTFDTADVYANTAAETVLGEALKGERRQSLEIFTRAMAPALKRKGVHLADLVIDVEFTPRMFAEPDPKPILTVRVGSTLEEVNRRLIEATMAECGNVRRKAAETLGISLKTLYNRLAQYNAERDGGKATSIRRWARRSAG